MEIPARLADAPWSDRNTCDPDRRPGGPFPRARTHRLGESCWIDGTIAGSFARRRHAEFRFRTFACVGGVRRILPVAISRACHSLCWQDRFWRNRIDAARPVFIEIRAMKTSTLLIRTP